MMTKQEAALEFLEELKDIPRGKPQLVAYASSYAQDMLRNQERMDRVSAKMRTLAFIYFLGGSMRAALVNFTQNYVTGIPFLAREVGAKSLKAEKLYHKAMFDVAVGKIERPHLAGDQPEPLRAVVLGRGLEQELHAEAAAEQRNAAARQLVEQLVEATGAQQLHSRGERADTGQDQAVGAPQRVVIGAQDGARADALDGLLHRAAVPDPVVDDPDGDRHQSVSVPFVDGMPVSAGSIATAWRSARANALNAASIMWWAFEPRETST